MDSTAGSLLALLVLLSLTAGCLGGPSGVPSPTSDTPTQTPDGHEAAMNQPDPDKEIRLQNQWNQTVTMRVRVIRDATNETVHDESYTLASGEERTAYNVSAAAPGGIESFTIVVSGLNATERVSIQTNECYGNAYAEIQDDGTVYLYYEIC